jgi:hypothetical protein
VIDLNLRGGVSAAQKGDCDSSKGRDQIAGQNSALPRFHYGRQVAGEYVVAGVAAVAVNVQPSGTEHS